MQIVPTVIITRPPHDVGASAAMLKTTPKAIEMRLARARARLQVVLQTN